MWYMKVLLAVVFLLYIHAPSFAAGGKQSKVAITEDYPALKSYETGFAHDVMRAPEGVRLFNIELIETDSPGAGLSEKGPSRQSLYGEIQAKKELTLDDPNARGAYLVFCMVRAGAKPLTVSVNKHTISYHPRTFGGKQGNSDNTRWFPIDPSWLSKGKNEIVLSYPEGTKADSWVIAVSRKDEFKRGGGDPAKAGLTSWRSVDGGKKWAQNALGDKGDIEGEYTVRLSLDRYRKTGWLAGPVIDLWRAPENGFIIPMTIINSVKISGQADVPAGTAVTWQVRHGAGPDPNAVYWSEYHTKGTGPAVSAELGDPGGRFFQWKAVLDTSDPRISPLVRSVKVERGVTRVDHLPDNIYVLGLENPELRYSSLFGEYERWDEPRLKILRSRENLDALVAGRKTQFEKMVCLLDYMAKRWVWVSPHPQYPHWDALDILDRIDQEGGGGMCIQFSIALIQALESFGIQARLVNAIGHELVEAWSDDYGKWVMLDPMQGSNVYNYSLKNGEPLGFEELHKVYLDLFYPDRPIDWLTDQMHYMKNPPGSPVAAGTLDKNWPRSSASDELFCGLANAAYMRIRTGSNWMANHEPEPLAHGSSEYAWTGYIDWYDDKTPPQRLQKTFTDRPADFWPTLNRVKMYAVTGPENDRVFLRFTTFTPNFDTYLIDVDEEGWKPCTEYYPWMLHSGQNKFRVRVKNKLGTLGKPSVVVINLADRPNLRERPGGNK